ncbi:MAG: histidine phosphatase family protein [Sinobacteraceae bacterium]|nr:histidine phosphatase family protein [Nevskiaceae bacterium]
MTRLTLMRHANAQWKDAELSDFDRPLNRRGESEAAAMGRRLLELRLVPTAVLTSPARRAWQTTEIVIRVLGLSARSMRAQESLYLAPADEILRTLHTIGPRIPHLMIVGHNPGITEVAHLLDSTSSIPGLATAAVCSLTFDTSSWADVTAEKFRDVLHETPPARLFALWA